MMLNNLIYGMLHNLQQGVTIELRDMLIGKQDNSGRIQVQIWKWYETHVVNSL